MLFRSRARQYDRKAERDGGAELAAYNAYLASLGGEARSDGVAQPGGEVRPDGADRPDGPTQ